MSLLLLDRAQLEVKTEGDTLALYEAGVRRGTVPIKLIERCVVHGAQTTLTSGVLLKLAEAGVTTVFMSPRQTRRVAMVLGPQHNDAAVRLAQAHRVMDEAACQHWAHGLVTAKLHRQQRTLQHLLAQRPDARKPLWDALQTLVPIQASLRSSPSGTSQPLPLDTLRGKEGAAARAYFSGLAGVMPPALGFTGRNRRPPRDPVNACLSLAYTLLHVQAVGACQAVGLDPLLGFYHRPSIGRESLASDLIEPLRPAVDLWVWELLRSRNLREEHFTTAQGACLLGKAGRAVFYATWERGSKPLRRWLRLQTQHLARQLRTQGMAWLQDDDDWEPDTPAN
jgi:CRISPR-associated protein Cas1